MSWWKKSVVYQIYPRSFYDSTGSGVGDLRGITDKLDHIQALGADVIWLCPVYRSGGDDGGYDISDYQAIAPEFGTMDDFDEMLAQMHARGLKLVMDLVINHSSDGHPWFQESRKSKDNPYRDWYIWRPGKANPDGTVSEPSNWGSHFGGPAWTFDEVGGEYYLHLFTPKQPDLNWENPQVRRALFAMMRWWLDKGVDGFRMDTVTMFSKVPDFPDMPLAQGQTHALAEPYFLNGPRLAEFFAEMKDQVLRHYDVLTVGEAPGVDPALGSVYTHETGGTLSMLFQFEHMYIDIDRSHPSPHYSKPKWPLSALRDVTTRWQTGMHGQGWNSQYLSNHDTPRLVSRFGDDGEYRLPSAKLLATFLHTLEGTPYIYQGDEIGMTDFPFTRFDQLKDVAAQNFIRDQRSKAVPDDQIMTMLRDKSRDNARTPMQWSAEPYAGFSRAGITSAAPWMELNPNYPDINVEAAEADPDSVLHYYRRLIHLRRTTPALIEGRYDLLLPGHLSVFAYTRTVGAQVALILLNFSANEVPLAWPAEVAQAGTELLIANLAAPAGPEAHFTLRPYEARVYLHRGSLD